jgi:Protein kinase domain
MEAIVGETTTNHHHDSSSMIMEVELSWEGNNSCSSILSGLLLDDRRGSSRGGPFNKLVADDDEQGYTARTSCCTLEEHEELTMTTAPATIRPQEAHEGKDNSSTREKNGGVEPVKLHDNSTASSRARKHNKEGTDMFWRRTSTLAASRNDVMVQAQVDDDGGDDDDEMMEPLPLTSESYSALEDYQILENDLDLDTSNRVNKDDDDDDDDDDQTLKEHGTDILGSEDDEMMEPLPLTATSDESQFDVLEDIADTQNDRSLDPLPYLEQIQQWNHQDPHPVMTDSSHPENEQAIPLEQQQHQQQHYVGYSPGQMDEDQPQQQQQQQQQQQDAHFNMTWTRAPRTFDETYTISNGGRPLGEGGFGVVYSCVAKHRHIMDDPLLPPQPRKHEAVKIIPAAYYNRNEIEILQHLGHSSFIVALQDIFFGFDRVYLVMEAMKGDLLTRMGDKVTYPEHEARTLVHTLLQAVQFLHSRGVAHRDIKPENILLTSNSDDTSIKLADFGLAKRFRDVNGNRFEQPDMFTLCGSVWYAAPEVFGRPREQMDCQPYDERCDIWSIGIITYSLLAGYLPFQEARDEYEVVRDACRGKYKFHKQYWSTISTQAKELIASLLKVHPVQRCTLQEALDSSWINPNNEAAQPIDHNTVSWTRNSSVMLV